MATTSHSGGLWLGLYFVLNLALTLYNKLVLLHFPFPYTLTALHALCGTVGTFCLLHASPQRPSVRGREAVVVLLFSVLYTLNIVVSNASLRLVTVPFHQCVRASAPLFTIALSALLLRKYSSKAKLVSLIPVMLGVALATYGDYYFTPRGFLLTLLGTLLAALKTIVTNLLQSPKPRDPLPPKPLTTPPQLYPPLSHNGSGTIPFRFPPPHPVENPKRSWPPLLTLPTLSLTPLQLLYLLSPLAFIQCTLLALFSGELDRVNLHLHRGHPRLWLLFNGLLAFALNVVSFNANRRVGALGMSVAANVKQVLAVLCSITLFNLTITRTNALGIGLALLGGAWYATVELREKRAQRRWRSAPSVSHPHHPHSHPLDHPHHPHHPRNIHNHQHHGNELKAPRYTDEKALKGIHAENTGGAYEEKGRGDNFYSEYYSEVETGRDYKERRYSQFANAGEVHRRALSLVDGPWVGRQRRAGADAPVNGELEKV
ncbi:triose-phosphate transporter family-domain-containing protein [Ephemerocybe angulata]|uniref:Triose-phosphate transporter family-domain-containing protein n=1 Tax=Ephemerocybe angulata TaxID=980116 RepID=A0A8H6M3T1_9AGAR|nr:triose-phosphate transporter family-domain-containing protein [Tulosesus angulatus]